MKDMDFTLYLHNIKYHARTEIHSQIKNIHFTVYVHFEEYQIMSDALSGKWNNISMGHLKMGNSNSIWDVCHVGLHTRSVYTLLCEAIRSADLVVGPPVVNMGEWPSSQKHTHSILIRPPVSETHGQKHQEHLSGHRLEKRTSYLISVFFSATALLLLCKAAMITLSHESWTNLWLCKHLSSWQTHNSHLPYQLLVLGLTAGACGELYE